MFRLWKKLGVVTARHRRAARLAVAGTLALACEGSGGLEDGVASRQEPLKNFVDKPLVTFASCTALNNWNGVIKDQHVVFPAGCTYKGQVKFMSSDATLDCNGSTIEGSPNGKVIVKPLQPANSAFTNNPHTAHAKYETFPAEGPSPLPEPLLAGIVIGRPNNVDGCRPEAPDVEDVTIRNCTVRGFYQGIRLDKQFGQQKVNNVCVTPSERTFYTGYDSSVDYDDPVANQGYWAEYPLERTELYNRAPKRVHIIDSTITRNGHAGINVTAYSQHFSIEGTTVLENGAAGIYLSHESRHNTIDHSTITRNGIGSSAAGYQISGKPTEVQTPGREGIAIDSSAHNTVSRNDIVDNYKGGITLYKNCGSEHKERVIVNGVVVEQAEPAVIKKQHADYNRIVQNRFSGHVNRTENDPTSGFGIWLAARQGQEYSTVRGASKHCRDVPITVNGVQRNHDYANFNTIAYNEFTDNWLSIRVSDDFNKIVGNRFLGTTKYDMYIGDDVFRGPLGEPVRGTMIVKNVSYSVLLPPEPRHIVLFGGSGDQTSFKGMMYYERRGTNPQTQNETCLTASQGFPFNDCTYPTQQLVDSIFWD